MTIRLNDSLPKLTGAIRFSVFATRTIGSGKRAKTTIGVGWQGWNNDPRMEEAMARLPGQGSFYWAGAIQAMHAAKRAFADLAVHQIKIETISGQEIARIYR
jgi:hypothetical protein